MNLPNANQLPSQASRICLCGGRKYRSFQRVCEVLNTLLDYYGSGITVITGGGTGLDELAHEWATLTCLNAPEQYKADWRTYRGSAGPQRNALMLATGLDLLVPFPGGHGTLDMIKRTVKARVPVWDPYSAWSVQLRTLDPIRYET